MAGTRATVEHSVSQIAAAAHQAQEADPSLIIDRHYLPVQDHLSAGKLGADSLAQVLEPWSAPTLLQH